MYREYFGLKELPFSIAPDPRYLYMSERHKEALAHLLYGVSGQGGFVVLTGEVGTGKTTICRCFLQQVPVNTDVAFIVNPKLSAKELLENICDEFGINYPPVASIKVFNDLISRYLLQAHSEGRHTVVIIDEAQNLRVDVLEQLRLLTNLETSEKKLLQIILLGQPELQDMLARKELRQLAQRVTARYHLKPLSKEEVGAYVRYRLAVAGQKQLLFSQAAINRIVKQSGGIPRLINLVCDRALLGSYSQNDLQVTPSHIKQAFKEIEGEKAPTSSFGVPKWVLVGSGFGLLFGALLIIIMSNVGLRDGSSALAGSTTTSDEGTSTQSISLSSEGGSLGISDAALRNSGATIAPISSAADCDEEGCDQSHDQSSVDLEAIDPKVHYGKQYIQSLTYVAPPFNSKEAAFKAVLRLWTVDYTREQGPLICEFIETLGLRCLHKNGNLRSLLEIDRPAVLKLVNHKGQDFYLGLLSVEGKYAKVSLGRKVGWTSLDAIDQQWYGEYSVVWQLPPYKSRLVKPGDESDKNKWLETNIQAARIAQKGMGQKNNIYRDDMRLEEKVRWFQKSVGLKADGVVGTLTLIQLNNFVRPNRPLLVRSPAKKASTKS